MKINRINIKPTLFKFWSLLLFLAASFSLSAQTIYVNDNSTTGDLYTTAIGNDVSGTGSASAPYATIQKAITVAVSGSTIQVDVGIFATAFTINKKLIIQGANTGKTGIDNRNAESQIKDVKVTISGSSEIVFDGFQIYQTTTALGGTISIGNTPTVLKNCIIQRVGSTSGVATFGIQTTSGNTAIIRIERNLFTGSTAGGLASLHRTWNSGIYCNGGSNITITNNTLQNCRTAINQDNMSTGISISNNIFGTNGTAIAFGGTTPTSGSFTLSGNTFSGIGTTINCSYVVNTFRLDITYSTIGTTAAADLTLAQCYSFENTLAHKGVSSKNGFVTYVSGKLFKTSTTSFANNILYATAGDIIHCNSGTSTETFTINKAVKLYGNNYNTNPNDASWNYNSSRNTESSIAGAGVTIASSNVEIKGFKFISITSNNTAIGNTNPSSSYSNILISNNWITGNNNVRPIWFTASVGFPFENIQVINNRIESNTVSPSTTLMSAIDLWRSTGHTVSGNYINGASYNGIKSDGNGIHTISNNRIIDCKVAGISIQSTYGNDQTVNVNSNTISGSQQGITAWSSTTNFSNIKFQITSNTIQIDAGKLDISYPAMNVANIQSGDNSYTNIIRENSITYSGTIGSSPYGMIPGTAYAAYGISILGNVGKLDIQNNSFDGGNVNGLNVPSPNLDMAAVMISTNFPIPFTESTVNTALSGTIRLLNNDFKNFKNGIVSYNYVNPGLDGIPSGTSLTINNNSILTAITGSSFLTGSNGQGINGTCNWYGSDNYATVNSKITGNVTFISFLVSGTDIDAGTLGFQPATGTCTGIELSTPNIGASSAIFTSIGQTSIAFSLTKGNGMRRLVFAKPGSAMNGEPVENTNYSANSNYGLGDVLDSAYLIFNDSGSDVTVNSLSTNTTYYFTVFEYNNSGLLYKYGTSSKYTTSATTLQPDADLDGVPDQDDEYPSNENMSFNNFYPANGFGTLMFEDLWPSKGDYDFNDLVLDYRYNVITDASDKVIEVRYQFVTRAIGGSFHNGFAFQLDGINPNKISSVSGSKASGVAWISLNSNGTEAEQGLNTNILVFDDAYKLLPTQGGFSFINVSPGAPDSGTDTTTIIVKFKDGSNFPVGGSLEYSSFPSSVFNPYMIIAQNRGKEVHLINRLPSAKANTSFFGKDQDRTDPNSGSYYKTAQNLPFAIDINTSVPYTIEKTDFSAAYLKFIDWASSAGTRSTNWYLNLDGNRDATKLWKK
jgi:LruC domain-containing protein